MLLAFLEIIGTIAFAISGALAAIRHRMDLSGAIVLGFIVGNGGGTLRDLLLNRPIFWMQNHWYIYGSVGVGLLTFIVAYFIPFPMKNNLRKLNWALMYCDAIGLGAFAVVGAQIAVSMHQSMLIIIMMGVLTATGGGVIRDILSNEVPLIFHGQLYATAALVGVVVFAIAIHYWPLHIIMLPSMIVIWVLRILALHLNWHLPFVPTLTPK